MKTFFFSLCIFVLKLKSLLVSFISTEYISFHGRIRKCFNSFRFSSDWFFIYAIFNGRENIGGSALVYIKA